MQYYTTELLSANQELTPEGFLLAKNVPIARTGVMLYAAGEVPVEAMQDGLIRIERTADQVFSDATLASFNGKPITLDHPHSDVTPENWSELAKGFIQNVRRGSGIEDDFVIADLLITDARAIQEVRDGLREVSCGYEADYEQIEPGRGRQLNIVGNHLALVDKGRCGPRCAIGDSGEFMKLKLFDRLRAAFKARDEKAFEDCMKDAESEESEEEKKKKDEEEEKKTSDAFDKFTQALDALSQRVDALDKKAKDESEEEGDDEDDDPENVEEEDVKDTDFFRGPDGEVHPIRSSSGYKRTKGGDPKKKRRRTRNSALPVSDETQDVFARVEILSPGLQLPTFDASADQQKTRDSLCALKRKALENAYAGKYRHAVAPFSGKTADFEKMTCDQLNYAFIGASEIVRIENNKQTTAVSFDASKHAHGVATKIIEINRANREFWHRQ